MASHSSMLAWRSPWTEESGGLQSLGSQRVRHVWATKLSTAQHSHFWSVEEKHVELMEILFPCSIYF